MGNTEEAFEFYRSVFKTDYVHPINRLGETPSDPSMPAHSAREKNMVLHFELPIVGSHLLMATDMIESMGHELKNGDNGTINLEPDSHEETDRLHDAHSAGGSEGSGMQGLFWARAGAPALIDSAFAGCSTSP